ncbi:hypothetical protein [Streptomyces sp. NPDC014746]
MTSRRPYASGRAPTDGAEEGVRSGTRRVVVRMTRDVERVAILEPVKKDV